MDDQPTLFIAQLVREAITRTIIVKRIIYGRIIYGRWGTRFVEEKTARLGVRLNYDASGEYKQRVFCFIGQSHAAMAVLCGYAKGGEV
jgi:hypothetical protein